MKRIILAIALLLLLLAACGSDDVSLADDGDDAPVDTTEAPTDSDDALPEDPDGDEPVDSNDDLPVDGDEPGDELPLGGGNLPIVTLDITITHPDAEPVMYSISCLGDTATVTGGVAGVADFSACGQLGDPDVRQRLVEGPPADQACTEQYGGPDIAKIVGTYDGVDGEPVNTTVDRTNGCGIFDWDVLLKGVLPTPVGINE